MFTMHACTLAHEGCCCTHAFEYSIQWHAGSPRLRKDVASAAKTQPGIEDAVRAYNIEYDLASQRM